ncbi:MAG: SPOR domain-containing protein [Bacteroidia bacterium]|nr:SPOR domain-containing protein [Bacteroidia bacterium]
MIDEKQNPAYSICNFESSDMSTQYKEITECLQLLVETQDFIVIPDFGALVTQTESAEFSLSQNIIFPPRKKILFNPLLKHNDGLLISEIQKKLQIEYALAQTLVNQFVNSLNVLLSTKRRADIDGVGFFYKDIHENILFESTLNPVYSSDSFGLFPISVAPLELEKENISVSNDESKKKVIRFEPKNLYKAAVVLLVVSLFFVYYWFSPFDINTHFANIAGTRRVYNHRINFTAYPVFENKYNELIVKPNNGVEVFPRKDDNTSNVNESKEANKRYSIIAGCFKIEENAKKLINKFQHNQVKAELKWNAEKQLFVVSVGQFGDKNNAVRYMDELKLKGVVTDAWIKEEK